MIEGATVVLSRTMFDVTMTAGITAALSLTMYDVSMTEGVTVAVSRRMYMYVLSKQWRCGDGSGGGASMWRGQQESRSGCGQQVSELAQHSG